jgi:hypothetical protein
VVLYGRSSTEERILSRGFGRLAEDGNLAIWSQSPQKGEDLWVYDIARNEATNLSAVGSGASWPDVVEGRVVWYSELIGADQPTAEIMVAARELEPTVRTTTTSGRASTTDSPSASSTTSADVVAGPELSWGEAATLEGRTISVSEPVEDPQATGSRPGWKVVYSIVTITNTTSATNTYAASEFFLEGNSSGSIGIGSTGIISDPEPTFGGQPLLKVTGGTLAPGRSVTGAIRFELKTEDIPVKVRLGSATSTRVVFATWQ